MKREVGIAFILFGRAQGTNSSLIAISFFLIERTKGDFKSRCSHNYCSNTVCRLTKSINWLRHLRKSLLYFIDKRIMIDLFYFHGIGRNKNEKKKKGSSKNQQAL